MGCGAGCKAGQLTALTYTIPQISATGAAINFADLTIKANLPINATVSTGTMCTVSQNSVNLAYPDTITVVNEYDTLTGALTATNVEFQTFMPLTDATTFNPAQSVSFKCNSYVNAPYAMTATYSGSITFNDGTNAYKINNLTFPTLAVNTISGKATPEPRSQYADGHLMFVFPSIAFPIHEFDVITISIPSSLYLWNKTNPAVCLYGGVPMEYLVSEDPAESVDKLRLIAPTIMDNNEGYMRFSCEVKKHSYTNDIGQVFNFNGLPAASAFDGVNLDVAITVTSLPSESGQYVTRYTGQVKLEPTVIPSVGSSLSIYAVPNYVGASNPIVVLAANPLTPTIAAGETIEFKLPSGWTVNSGVTAECKGGFKTTSMDVTSETGTAVITAAAGGGVDVAFTADSEVPSSEGSTAVFRLFCKGISLPASATAASSTTVNVKNNVEVVATSSNVAIEAILASQPDPAFVKHTFTISATRPLYSAELQSLPAAYAAVAGFSTQYVSLGKHVFTPASLPGVDPVVVAAVDLEMLVSSTNEYVLSEVETIANQLKKPIADRIGQTLALTVQNEKSTIAVTSVAAACFGETPTCGGECAQCGTGAACTANEECLSLKCENQVCAATKNGAAVASVFVAMLAVVVAVFAF